MWSHWLTRPPVNNTARQHNKGSNEAMKLPGLTWVVAQLTFGSYFVPHLLRAPGFIQIWSVILHWVIGFVSIMVTHSVPYDTLQNSHSRPLGNKYLPLFGQCHFMVDCVFGGVQLWWSWDLLVASLNYFAIKLFGSVFILLACIYMRYCSALLCYCPKISAA